MNSIDERAQAFLTQLRREPEVWGCLLLGSRGKQFHRPTSDYDLTVVVADGQRQALSRRLEPADGKDLDIVFISMAEFRDYAAWGSDSQWDRYDFAHYHVLWDPHGVVDALAAEKGTIPPAVWWSFMAGSLDGYINAVFRSVKCWSRDDSLGSHLEGAASIPLLLDVVFGLEHRLKPFAGYLVQELEVYPLQGLPWSYQELLHNITTVLRHGDVEAQQRLLRVVELTARARGFDDVFDAWDGKDQWAMTYTRHS